MHKIGVRASAKAYAVDAALVLRRAGLPPEAGDSVSSGFAMKSLGANWMKQRWDSPRTIDLLITYEQSVGPANDGNVFYVYLSAAPNTDYDGALVGTYPMDWGGTMRLSFTPEMLKVAAQNEGLSGDLQLFVICAAPAGNETGWACRVEV